MEKSDILKEHSQGVSSNSLHHLSVCTYRINVSANRQSNLVLLLLRLTK